MTTPQDQIPPYNAQLCTFSSLKTLMEKYKTAEQMCKFVANGICNGPHHYLNMYKLYFCYLNEHKGTFILLTTILAIFLFFSLNYIRRAYFARPILNLRKVLGISDTMAEVILVPFAFGIVPLFMRLQGAYKDVSYSFNMAGTLGSMLTLTAFVIGICSIVLKISRKVDQKKVMIDLVFILVCCFLIFLIGLKREVEWMDGIVLVGLWIVYLFIIFWKGIVDKSNSLFINLFYRK